MKKIAQSRPKPQSNVIPFPSPAPKARPEIDLFEWLTGGDACRLRGDLNNGSEFKIIDSKDAVIWELRRVG